MKTYRFWAAAAFAAMLAPAAAESQVATAPAPPTYADVADLALAAPVVAHVAVDDAARLRGAEAAGVRPGETRFYVEADVVALIRGAQGLPARVRYLVDLPDDARGRPPKLRDGSQFLLLAAHDPARPGELRLIGPHAQFPYAPATAQQLRDILGEATAPNAPPPITGIGRAFHVPGAIPGESETQVFLLTEGNRPVSLSILRRPGQTPVWAVALSEIVDDAAAAPRPQSLLWYRLACSLPPALPPQSLAGAEPGQAAPIQADYRFVMQQLGPCARTLRR